ncbi:MAG: hypothetical protein JRI23_09645, partial [Deltaproteobacteria bacterium]|nr:hypothetical protein [Deltaproteobacteria bacterium]MBW2531918.1 hypothetical protein [Deltaproteobacteria bacterium]
MRRHSTLAAAIALAVASLFAGATGCGVDPGQQESDWSEVDTGIDPVSCPGGAPHLVDGRPATWTVLHYSAGDNNLEQALVGDIDEMELGHQGSRNVNVVVQLDKESEPGRWRYHIQPDRTDGEIPSPVVEYSEVEPDSGDWRELSEFGRWGVTCYPAEHYVLIVSGHGGGWTSTDDAAIPIEQRARHARARQHGESLRMIAPDDTDHSEMYVDQLVEALGEIRAATRRPSDPDYLNRLVMYGSDACLMGTIEVAYDLRNAVTYLVASEQTEPNDGWPYNVLVRELSSRPSYYAVRPHLLATTIVEAYGRSYAPGGAAKDEDKVTLAAIDTSALIRARNRVRKIAELLPQLMELDPELRATMDEVREQSYSFGDDYTDLGRFLALLEQSMLAAGKMPTVGQTWDGDERWRTLRNAMDELMQEIWPELVLGNVAGQYEGARGLSIFLPTDECGWGLSTRDYARSSFAEDSGWGALVQQLVGRQGGDYQEGYGRGRMYYQAFGQSFEAKLECHLRDGELSMYMLSWERTCNEEDPSCIPQLDLSLDIDVEHQQVTEASMWCGKLGLQGAIRDVSL